MTLVLILGAENTQIHWLQRVSDSRYGLKQDSGIGGARKPTAGKPRVVVTVCTWAALSHLCAMGRWHPCVVISSHSPAARWRAKKLNGNPCVPLQFAMIRSVKSRTIMQSWTNKSFNKAIQESSLLQPFNTDFLAAMAAPKSQGPSNQVFEKEFQSRGLHASGPRWRPQPPARSMASGYGCRSLH